MSNNLISCLKISVNCVANDPVDIRCGGPEYLGFDFNVKQDETEDMKKFIAVTLDSFKVPLVNIYVSEIVDLTIKDVWTKERIIKAIKEDAKYLQGEAERGYPSSLNKTNNEKSIIPKDKTSITEETKGPTLLKKRS